MADAQSALDRDRLDEARRLASGLLRELPGVAAVHELAGLVAYRLGRWRDAVRELEAAQVLNPRVDLLPVLADSYRALKRWTDVDRIWTEVRELSPSHDIMAEARIVAAGAQADRGDLTGALTTMASVTARPKRVREHHLRLWYVLGDLHDRAGNPIEATRSVRARRSRGPGLRRRHDPSPVPRTLIAFALTPLRSVRASSSSGFAALSLKRRASKLAFRRRRGGYRPLPHPRRCGTAARLRDRIASPAPQVAFAGGRPCGRGCRAWPGAPPSDRIGKMPASRHTGSMSDQS